jgi:hypothetical protein
MTLAQLQEIGKEVGIAPEMVAHAASAIDRVGSPTSRSFLGLPIGVGRTVDLGRKLTDEEWERLVVDLRETFDARGNVKREGSLRQWTNGNLQALLEPTATGHRVRLRTVKANALAWMTGGLVMVGVAAFTTLVAALGISNAGLPLQTSALITIIGAGMFGIGALQVTGWAKIRRQQMEDIAARLSSTAKSLPSQDPRIEG